MSREVRACRFDWEEPGSDSMFKMYTQETCRFECGIKLSYARCGCIPWDYPRRDADIDGNYPKGLM